MELDQYLYLRGEVCKLFRMPQGPDSAFIFYTSSGKRRDYFDTSPTDHAIDEPCYIVESHTPSEKLVNNGLPVFTLNYQNDDDADRELGSDSRLHFTAPTAGSYLARITDNRGRGGERFCYPLTVRHPDPGFTVTLNNGSPTLNPGTGRQFSVTAKRIDGFEGPITVEITNVPSGFYISSPIVIEDGLTEATGTINCNTNSMEPKPEEVAKIKVSATAMVEGMEMSKAVNTFDKIKLGEKAKLLVDFEPYDAANTNFTARSVTNKPMEITIAPGETVPAWLKIERHGLDGLVTFTGENFPHGVIIDNIGLSGVLIPADETRRQIFLFAPKWVPDSDRLCHCKAAQEGEPTTLPILLHVRHRN